MNLYELATNYNELLDYLQSVDTADEGNQQVYEDTLSALDGAIEDKAENIVHVLHQLRADEETLDKEIKRLRDKKRALANNQRNLKEYLQDTMEYAGKEKIKTPLFSLWIQNNPPRMVVDDDAHIPESFYIEQEPKLDAKQLREYLKDHEVDGVRMEQSRGVRFR